MKKTISLFLLAATASTSFAQVQPQQVPDKPYETPKREESSQQAATKAAREAAKRQAGGEEDVTWEQVMAKPDDIELNYRFAQTQIRQGNLKGAVATLERLLLVDPGLAKVRLLYALVLFRLGDLDGSERELNTLKKGSVPEDLKAQINDYLAQIEKQRRRTHINAALSLGFGYDDNRNAAPSSGQRLFGDVAFP